MLGGAFRTFVFVSAILRGRSAGVALSSCLELGLAIAIAGVMGAFAQAYRLCRPTWAIALVLGIESMVLCQSLELAIHMAGGTQHAGRGILASALFSLAASASTVFFMKRGYLLTSDAEHSGHKLFLDLNKRDMTQ
ncbi:MAG TPA: hypothetical protein VKU01_17510 [Bryobacteraceae bacterium]|nr:hypothetical protein [Bryobacteraceae bacterium]